MAALKIDMTIPLGAAGHVQLIIDIGSVAQLAEHDRAFLADTLGEFCAFAARTLTPAPAIAELKSELAPTVHDPSAAVLRGVTGSRIREKL